MSCGVSANEYSFSTCTLVLLVDSMINIHSLSMKSENVRRPFSVQSEIKRKGSQIIFPVFDLKHEREAKFFSLQNEKR